MSKLVIKVEGDIPDVEGKTFQLHVLSGNRLQLYSVVLEREWDNRCPIIIGGVRCCERIGHEGKHHWANGD